MTVYTGNLAITGGFAAANGASETYSGSFGVTLTVTLDGSGNGTASEAVTGTLNYTYTYPSGGQFSGTAPFDFSDANFAIQSGSFSANEQIPLQLAGAQFGVTLTGAVSGDLHSISENILASVSGTYKMVAFYANIQASGTLVQALPAIAGTAANQATTDASTISPFHNVVVTDLNSGESETVTVTLSAAANGTLSNLGGGSYNAATGVYTVSGSAAAVTAALEGLVFQPALHQSPGGQIVTTGFAIGVTDTDGASASDGNTSIVTTETGNIARTDLNGDGKSDIIWQSSDGTPAVWFLNSGTMTGGGLAGANPGPAWHLIATGDFNGDGKADLAWQNNDGTVAIWLMNGTTLISGAAPSANPGPDWVLSGTGDFNGDGKSDLIFRNSSTGQVAIWELNGTTLIGGGSPGNPGTSWHIKGIGDFNGDGKSDILWQNNDGTVAIWLMDGTTMIGGGSPGTNPGPAWQVIGAGDFNGDGKSDILFQNTNGQAAIWYINGTTMTGGGAAGTNPGTSWHAMGTGDYNGDGYADILWQNTDGTPAVWLMNGTTLLSGAAPGSNPGTSWHVIAATGG